MAIRFSQCHLLKRLSFSCWVSLALSPQSFGCTCEGLFLGSQVFHWAMCLFPWWWCTFVFGTVTLYCVLKSGNFCSCSKQLQLFGVFLWLRKNFRLFFFYFCEVCHQDFDGVALNLLIALGTMHILAILILLTTTVEYLSTYLYLCSFYFFPQCFLGVLYKVRTPWLTSSLSHCWFLVLF